MRNENVDGKLEAKLKGAKEAAETQKAFGTNLSGSVDILVGHLDRLATAVSKATDKINNKPGMQVAK